MKNSARIAIALPLTKFRLPSKFLPGSYPAFVFSRMTMLAPCPVCVDKHPKIARTHGMVQQFFLGGLYRGIMVVLWGL